MTSDSTPITQRGDANLRKTVISCSLKRQRVRMNLLEANFVKSYFDSADWCLNKENYECLPSAIHKKQEQRDKEEIKQEEISKENKPSTEEMELLPVSQPKETPEGREKLYRNLRLGDANIIAKKRLEQGNRVSLLSCNRY